jgi:hypothetical protein
MFGGFFTGKIRHGLRAGLKRQAEVRFGVFVLKKCIRRFG